MEGKTASEGRVRVIGALTGPPLELLLEMVGRAEVRLDLSEVREVGPRPSAEAVGSAA